MSNAASDAHQLSKMNKIYKYPEGKFLKSTTPIQKNVSVLWANEAILQNFCGWTFFSSDELTREENENM